MNLKGIFIKEKEKSPLEIFLEEKEQCEGPFYHIVGNIKDPDENPDSFYHIGGVIDDPTLVQIDSYYKVADKLSVQNARKHERNLQIIPYVAIALTVVFFFYFELEIHFLIALCVLLLIALDLIHRRAKKSDCHRKYLEYRVLAETLRVQFFLSISGMEKEAIELLPWFTKKGIPWIEDILNKIELKKVKEKQPILHIWILDQKSYHEEALSKALKKKKKEDIIKKTALYVTIIAYLGGLIFESIIYFYSPDVATLLRPIFGTNILGHPINEHTIRILIKATIGIASISILFIENYFGKMSLTETINDHKRMFKLYQKVEEDIRDNKGKESPEIIINLAREFLNENSTWYAYQSKNNIDLVL